jgi:hypothetical protein
MNIWCVEQNQYPSDPANLLHVDTLDKIVQHNRDILAREVNSTYLVVHCCNSIDEASDFANSYRQYIYDNFPEI